MISFSERHIGPRANDKTAMLKELGLSSIDQLIDETIPENILLEKSMDLPDALNESELLDHMKKIGRKSILNKLNYK